MIKDFAVHYVECTATMHYVEFTACRAPHMVHGESCVSTNSTTAALSGVIYSKRLESARSVTDAFSINFSILFPLLVTISFFS